MNKKTTIFLGILVIITLVLLVIVCVVVSFFKNNENGTVFVGRKYYTDVELFLDPYQESLHLPLASTLHHLGYEINQGDEDTVIIQKENMRFELNLEECTLYGNTEPYMNLLEREPGPPRYRYCEINNGDADMDIESFRITYNLMASDYWIVHLKKLKVVFFIPR